MAVPERATSESDERRWIALLLFAALVVRLAWLGELATLPWAEQLPTDSFLYDQAARRIATGDWQLGDQPLRMSPAYFYVVGLVHLVCGSGVWSIRLLQVAAGVATVFVTWRVAKQLVTARWALLAAGLVAFAGPLVFFDGAILPESLSTLLLVSVAWLSLQCLEREDQARSPWRSWAALGLALGLLSALRPNAILLLPVSMLFAWRAPVDRAERTRRAASVLIAAMIAIAPITARNAIASGRFVPLTSHGGVNLFVGNGPGANGTFRVPAEVPGGGSPSTQFDAFREAASQAIGHEVDEAESDAYWQRRTLAHVSAHPLDATVLVARKIHLLFNARELGLVLPYAFSREATRTMGAPLVQSGWLAPFALVGLLLALCARRDDDEARVTRERTVATITLVFALSVALVFVTDRYRAPLLPLFAVHAVSLIERVASAARARAWRFVGVIGLAFALAVALAVPVRANQHFEREWLALGDGFLELDEPSRALDAYQHALALAPEDPLARRGIERATAASGGVDPRGR
ncbi:MAG: glycosyltransferase family 39 protein [Deltaproteobacteria bacterium]|nr:glycosyltransferase family 39 protein [Deltaproteobacteria bacterium]